MTGVSAVVVSFNSRDVLERCLTSLDGAVSEVIVVDNASTDGSAELAASCVRGSQVVRQDVNDGFGAAANTGIMLAENELVLLLNADVSVEARAVDALVACAAADPRVGAVGPRLVSIDGRPQVSVLRIPTAFWLGRPAVSSMGGGERKARRSVEPNAFLVGAALLLRRRALAEIGGFDSDFFMFGEDIDLCHRLRHQGWAIHHCPDAQFVHLGGGSTRQDWPRLFREQLRSHLRFLFKHRGHASAQLARMVLVGSLATRSLVQQGESRRTSRAAARWLATTPLGDLLAERRPVTAA